MNNLDKFLAERKLTHKIWDGKSLNTAYGTNGANSNLKRLIQWQLLSFPFLPRLQVPLCSAPLCFKVKDNL